MHFRFFAIATAIVALIAAYGCVAADESGIGADGDCVAHCPAGSVEVDRCPARTTCQEVFGCDDTPILCAPALSVNDDNGEESPPEPDCDEPIECPTGSSAVVSCPDDALCTRITLCETELLCEESPQWCEQQPICLDDRRPVSDCDDIDDEYCERRHHCSGPVHCLECHDELPSGCPEGMESVDEETCEGEEIDCQRVETCHETLHCIGEPRDCIEFPHCLGETEQVPSCKDDDPQCFAIDGCEQTLFCSVDDEDCMAVPTCPADYLEVEIDACIDEFDDCLIETECGQIIGCLPDDQG